MITAKTALAASMILAMPGLAGCQTTEERVYYSSAPAPVATAWVYEDGPRWREPPPRIWRDAPPAVWGGPEPIHRHHPPRWEPPHRPPIARDPGGRFDHHPPIPRDPGGRFEHRPPHDGGGRFTNGPTPDPRYRHVP